MRGAHLFRARLQDAELFQARLQGVDLRGAQLQGANLSLAQLQGADLRSARLQGADLRSAQLQGTKLSYAQLQGADLSSAELQGADLNEAQLQGADLNEAELQGADLSHAQLQGADLSKADMASSDLSATFVFRTNIADADLSTSAVRSVHADRVKGGETGEIKYLDQPDVDAWITAATQFVAETDKEAIGKRFERLKPDFKDGPDEVTLPGMEEALLALDPNGAQHRQHLAKFLGDLACERADAPHVARSLVGHPGSGSDDPGLLAALGEQLESVRKRMTDGRENAETCPGVTGFTEEDWKRLEEIKPVEAAHTNP